MTDYLAIIHRFAADGVIGEMDGVYSSWASRAAGGFTDDQIAAHQRLIPSPIDQNPCAHWPVQWT
jgi:adenylate cyclase